ncbi:VOC family protein [Rhizobium sp. C4]|uniref:VOC family protein n=1 Tax=Rhizobium sp. C4 TaxID=1349800 RepID=UPI001E5B6E84|nr:VOC family protein [Rhizobium sp. C4]MCD2171342.1 VOC family protein [Rhizobium sp. C4]
MLKLDHITVIAPTLEDGVRHVADCLGLLVPFGTRHDYMGTHNHRLQLGNATYLEIVALDRQGTQPGRARWFGLDDQDTVRKDWSEGRRLRGWVANTTSLDKVLAEHQDIFGQKACLPTGEPDFAFAIPEDGSLPLGGAAPSLIDHWGDTSFIDTIPDMGARLRTMTLEHPDPDRIRRLYADLKVTNAPLVTYGPELRYSAVIDTPNGTRHLT